MKSAPTGPGEYLASFRLEDRGRVALPAGVELVSEIPLGDRVVLVLRVSGPTPASVRGALGAIRPAPLDVVPNRAVGPLKGGGHAD